MGHSRPLFLYFRLFKTVTRTELIPTDTLGLEHWSAAPWAVSSSLSEDKTILAQVTHQHSRTFRVKSRLETQRLILSFVI